MASQRAAARLEDQIASLGDLSRQELAERWQVHFKMQPPKGTRKSTEEGLDQDFNSLDAQRAACEAYIKSQAGEGWVVVRSRIEPVTNWQK